MAEVSGLSRINLIKEKGYPVFTLTEQSQTNSLLIKTLKVKVIIIWDRIGISKLPQRFPRVKILRGQCRILKKGDETDLW